MIEILAGAGAVGLFMLIGSLALLVLWEIFK